MSRESEFYVGYLPIPGGIGKFIRRVVGGLGIVAVTTAAILIAGQHPFAPVMNRRQWRNTFRPQASRKIVNLPRISNRNNLRPMSLDLSGQFIKIASRGQSDHRKSLGQRLHHRETLLPNRARRPQDGQFRESSRHNSILSIAICKTATML